MLDMKDEKKDGILIFKLSGKLDSVTSTSFSEKIIALVDKGESKIILDLTDMVYISSAGLRVFLMIAKRIKSINGKVILSALQDSVKEVFEMSGFSTIFEINSTTADALTKF